ncbi:hypothetical protein CDAR_509941 [Caerostris darwini]|uniref:Secreted protein n=1 Tax=Caerostris darwini TaxID=1538125 RepID=A0AAV4TYG7_9ARAC|nr:hypothetical protein CDAR_509941 [Caerostris darwini]
MFVGLWYLFFGQASHCSSMTRQVQCSDSIVLGTEPTVVHQTGDVERGTNTGNSQNRRHYSIPASMSSSYA